MSLEAQYRAIYQLVYKRGTRDAFQQAKFQRFEGTTDDESKQLKVLSSLRLDVVVRLHANDIGANWYAPRFPVTWLGLQVALDEEQAQLTGRLTQSDAFELRVDDDRDGRALTAFIEELATDKKLDNAPWLPDMMRYERLISGIWADDVNPRVERFGWDVAGIGESLIEKRLFPVEEEPSVCEVLLFKDEAGVTEIALHDEQARVMRKMINKQNVKDEPAKLVAQCRRALRKICE